MRRLVYYIASTLDGFVAGPDGGDPTGPDGFWPMHADYLEHIVAEYPETLPAPARTALHVTAAGTHFDTVIEGRRSYQLGLDAGIPDAYPHLRHVVVSRTLAESPAAEVEIVRDDPVARVRELKAEQGRDIWLIGGGELAGALYPEIDRLVLKLAAVTTGAGIPLFGSAGFGPAHWTRTGCVALDSGALFLTYDRA